MLRAVCSTALFAVPIMLTACGSPDVPTQPLSIAGSVSSTGALINDKKDDHKTKDNVVRLLDECDGPTFNANPPAGVGPGTCSRRHGIAPSSCKHHSSSQLPRSLCDATLLQHSSP